MYYTLTPDKTNNNEKIVLREDISLEEWIKIHSEMYNQRSRWLMIKKLPNLWYCMN